MSRQLKAEIQSAVAALTHQNVPALRAIRKQWSKQLQQSSGPEVLALAIDLQQIGSSSLRFIAAELVHHHPLARSSINTAWLRRFGRGMATWDQVDVFGCFLSGPAWREGNVVDAEIHRWAKSSDRWWRRAALVSTVPLNNKTRGGSGNAKRTLDVCRLLISDRDDMVVKAMSWALRELAKRDAAAVQTFINKYRDQLAPRVLREVGNKLRTGKKNPR
jgi:3-methyladenine DNA glycosylase AlkD